jgi:hypothetical protein
LSSPVQPLMVFIGECCGCKTKHFPEYIIVLIISQWVNSNGNVSSCSAHNCPTVVFVLWQ